MIVLDASALIDVLIDQPNKPSILPYLDDHILAPTHQPAEVLSAIARLHRAGTLSASDAGDAAREATLLQQEFIPLDEQLLLRALEFDGRIRALDGLYVAVAQLHDCPLLTTDRRLVRAEPPCEILWPVE